MPKAVDDNVKADIQSAVESIAREFSSGTEHVQESKKMRYLSHGTHTKHIAIFSGVFAFALLVSVMWILNLRQSYSLLDFTNSTEDVIFSSTKNDFAAVLETFSAKETAQELRNQASVSAELSEALDKQSLKEVLGAAMKSSTTTSSTTLNVPPTTSTIE